MTYSLIMRHYPLCARVFMKAAEIEGYIPEDIRLPVILTECEADLVRAINLCLRPLRTLRDGQVRRVFIPADKGTPSDIPVKCHYITDHIALWKELYPDSQAWYMLDVFSHGEISALIFAGRLALYTSETIGEAGLKRKSLVPLLEWLIDSCAGIRQMMISGTYHDYLESCFPLRLIPGIMKSCDYWKYAPEEKARFLGKLSKAEIEYFIINSGAVRRRATRSASFEKLGILASACSRALDGRPFTFLSDDAVAITDRIYLLIKRDDSGFYIELGGGTYEDTEKLVKCFNALNQTSFPVLCKDGRMIRTRLKGEALLAVVPETMSDYHLFFQRLDIREVQYAVPYPHLTEAETEAFRSAGKWEGVPDYS